MKLFFFLKPKRVFWPVISSFLALSIINGCSFKNNISDKTKYPIAKKEKIKHFLVMNHIDFNTKKFIETEIENDKSKILNCNIKENDDAICAANILDLNHDKIPEIIFENEPVYTKQGEIVILSKINNRWEYYPLISEGFSFFGNGTRNARIDFYEGNVTNIKPLWNDIKYEDFILSAEYGGEPPPPIESFSLFERLFGIFPTYYAPKDRAKFSPNSLQIITGNKIIPKEIYEQDFEYSAGEVPSCLDTKPTKFICYAISIDINEDGKNEILYLDSNKNFKALYKTSEKWEIISYNSPYKGAFSPDIKKLATNPNLLKIEQTIFDDIQIGKYSFRPSQLPCNELGENRLIWCK